MTETPVNAREQATHTPHTSDHAPQSYRYRIATPPSNNPLPAVTSAESGSSIWWAQQDSNLRPTDYESAALTN